MAKDARNDRSRTGSRRDALVAVPKYAAVVGGAAVLILSVDDAVAQASACPPGRGNGSENGYGNGRRNGNGTGRVRL